MSSIDSGSITQILGAGVIALITLVIGMQRMLKGWKETGAETSIISLMHQELERMSVQNTTLATELNKLQIEVLNVNSELRNLNLENRRLRDEIVVLTLEISMLQKRLSSGGNQ